MKFYTPLFIYARPSKDNFLNIENKFMRKIIFKSHMNVYRRTLLSEAQNHKCCWCGIMTTEERNKKHSSTIEHVECRSCGGSDEFENLAMSCSMCNSNRGSMTIEEFMKRVEPENGTLSGKKNKHKRNKINRLKKLYQDPQLVWC